MNKVSLIITAYNLEKYIGKCIESCINQTYKNIEVIIINDESKDNTEKVIKKYVKLDSRVKLINQKNQGVSVARNRGIEEATGEWISFIDGDDWLEENAVELMIKEADDNIDILLTNYYSEYIDKTEKNNFLIYDNHLFTNDKLDLIKSCIIKTDITNPNNSTNIGVPWAKLYRRSFLIKNDCKFEIGLKRMQDMIFNINTFYKAKKIKYTNILSYHYRLLNISVTNKYTSDFSDTSLKILNCINRFIEENNLQSDFSEIISIKAIRLFSETIKLQYAANNDKRSLLKIRKSILNKLDENIYLKNTSFKNKNEIERNIKILNFLIKHKLVLTIYFIQKHKNKRKVKIIYNGEKNEK